MMCTLFAVHRIGGSTSLRSAPSARARSGRGRSGRGSATPTRTPTSSSPPSDSACPIYFAATP
eukprot:2249783-Heterocapsa_arctica.AAC.1